MTKSEARRLEIVLTTLRDSNMLRESTVAEVLSNLQAGRRKAAIAYRIGKLSRRVEDLDSRIKRAVEIIHSLRMQGTRLGELFTISQKEALELLAHLTVCAAGLAEAPDDPVRIAPDAGPDKPAPVNFYKECGEHG